jgi:hypothetical protein
VLLDLHALPNGVNPDDHSGTNSSVSRFFNSQCNRDLGVRCCQFITQEAHNGLDIVGLQIANEAGWESEGLYEWYDECMATISAIDPSIPVVISDAWNLSKAIEYSLQKNTPYPSEPTCPVIIDTHIYYAFSEADKAKTPQQIIAEVPTRITEIDAKEGSVITRGAVQPIIGEYSNVLSDESWAKADDGTPKQELVRRFGAAQSLRYQQRTGGAFFWTWKMEWMPGGEWGFKAQASPDPATGTRAIVPPTHSLIPPYQIYSLLERALHRKDERMWTAVNQHVMYWEHLHPNSDQPSEH